MALFSKRQNIRDNKIENVGRWPIRLTDFYLVDDYEFPPSHYTEIFLVRSGHFLHETETGAQAVRAGTAMVHHPSSRHVIKQPEQVRLTRVRFLPEWFVGDFSSVMDAPDVLSLFFARHWFQVPSDTNLQVFTVRESQLPFLDSAFELLAQSLRTGRHIEPISQVTLLQIMLILGDEYHVYWRGGNRLPITEGVATSLEIIERAVASGRRLPLKQLQIAADGGSQDEISQDLRKHVGMTLIDYVQSRRLQHAARKLLATNDDPAEIAEAVVLSDASQFEKSFETAFGFLPQVYREKFGAAPRPVAGTPGESAI